MATDVDVQYFSHLNGLTLGNNWGDLIRLLDKALVTGIDFTQITSASINEQGDVIINLYAAHNAMLFQVVELLGFAPASLNQKYRIKGVPNTTQLILKPKTDIIERTITTMGAGKLASLGYEIVFRDTNDVKRVYRAKNPTAQHPFIRVDESTSSATGIYPATCARSAMVGLIENMTHIDDYESTEKQQLPFLPSNPSKNWSITATGAGQWDVVRGFSKWYYATQSASQPVADNTAFSEYFPPAVLDRYFTLFGDQDAFYINRNLGQNTKHKILSGCGLYDSSLPSDTTPNWFLMSTFYEKTAGANDSWGMMQKALPLCRSEQSGAFMLVKYTSTKPTPNVNGYGLMPDYMTGNTNLYSSNNSAALEIPIYDADKYLRGALKHVNYSGKWHNNISGETTPLIFENSMYLWETVAVGLGALPGGVMAYLGELE
ncbi:hypothetical protein Q8H44_03720 [Acinetobacter lwoffii]|uniref:hypothetical protein n=1 Tax=Acinetobacter lwoffii TaxID=28090 RepID=UPI00272FE3E0|nr:hypothetical protein [Acinetobacter lwoffii]MDP1316009.1 hypothetical protein [Acinetobacter lwoffii]